jgi:hypothetical protein
MKKITSIFVMLVALSMFSFNLYAQDNETSDHILDMGIPEIALLDTDATPISLLLTTTEAGEAISGGTGTGYAQVSSIVSLGETRTITASVVGVPAGTSLTVDTSPPTNGNEGGVLGTGSTGIALINNDPAVVLVTGIGSCYTGTAASDGYVFDYIWDSGAAANYGSIVATTGSTATVTLTITDTP